MALNPLLHRVSARTGATPRVPSPPKVKSDDVVCSVDPWSGNIQCFPRVKVSRRRIRLGNPAQCYTTPNKCAEDFEHTGSVTQKICCPKGDLSGAAAAASHAAARQGNPCDLRDGKYSGGGFTGNPCPMELNTQPYVSNPCDPRDGKYSGGGFTGNPADVEVTEISSGDVEAILASWSNQDAISTARELLRTIGTPHHMCKNAIVWLAPNGVAQVTVQDEPGENVYSTAAMDLANARRLVSSMDSVSVDQNNGTVTVRASNVGDTNKKMTYAADVLNGRMPAGRTAYRKHASRVTNPYFAGGYPYGWYGYGGYGGYGYPQTSYVTQTVCERIPGNMECPDGTVVRRNADGSKTCCPPPQQQYSTYYYPYYYPTFYAYPFFRFGHHGHKHGGSGTGGFGPGGVISGGGGGVISGGGGAVSGSGT